MKRYESMRGYFGYYLHEQMAKNNDIWVVTADLGYGLFDSIREDYPERFINCGAAEQVGCGMSIGLALEGKIPFFYSITPFLLGRAFEWIRNYVDHEEIPVKLVGSGRDHDYAHDGFSHFAGDDKDILAIFKNITAVWPNNKEDIPSLLEEMITTNKPYYINLKR